jgi:hypothetical protein
VSIQQKHQLKSNGYDSSLRKEKKNGMGVGGWGHGQKRIMLIVIERTPKNTPYAPLHNLYLAQLKIKAVVCKLLPTLSHRILLL